MFNLRLCCRGISCLFSLMPLYGKAEQQQLPQDVAAGRWLVCLFVAFHVFLMPPVPGTYGNLSFVWLE